MKVTSRQTRIMLFLAIGLGLSVGFLAPGALGGDFGLNQINFLGASYDSGEDATTFTYEVVAAWNMPFEFWILELRPDCFGAGDIVDASEPWEYANPDSFTFVYGIKFTQPYAAGESRIVWFRIKGDLSTTLVRIVLSQDCSYWWGERDGPDCPGEPTPTPPPEGEGMSPGYWKNQLAIYLGNKGGKLKEPNVESYALQYGYTAEEAYAILSVKHGEPVDHLHKQLLAAKLSTAAGYLSNMAELLEWGQYMVAHPEEFTENEITLAKNLFESLHD